MTMLNHSTFHNTGRHAPFLWVAVFLLGGFLISSCGGENGSGTGKAADNVRGLLIEQGLQAMRAKNFEAAKTAFTELMNQNPKDAEAIGYMALLMAKQDRKDDVFKFSKSALEIDPNLGLPHTALGITYFQSADFDQALAHSRKALQIDPNLADSYLVIGEILLRQGQVDKSLPILQQGVKLSPKDPESYKKLSAAQIKSKDYKSAFETLQTALKLDPKVAGIHFNLAVVYGEMGDGKKAMYHIDRAEKLYTEEELTRWAAKSRHTKQFLAGKFNLSPDDIKP